MKEFKCSECGKYLGEMTKGKIHKDSSILCERCMETYKTFKSLADFKKNDGSNFDSNMFGVDGIFDIFDKMGLNKK